MNVPGRRHSRGPQRRHSCNGHPTLSPWLRSRSSSRTMVGLHIALLQRARPLCSAAVEARSRPRPRGRERRNWDRPICDEGCCGVFAQRSMRRRRRSTGAGCVCPARAFPSPRGPRPSSKSTCSCPGAARTDTRSDNSCARPLRACHLGSGACRTRALQRSCVRVRLRPSLVCLIAGMLLLLFMAIPLLSRLPCVERVPQCFHAGIAPGSVTSLSPPPHRTRLTVVFNTGVWRW